MGGFAEEKGHVTLVLDACRSGGIVNETIVPSDGLSREFCTRSTERSHSVFRSFLIYRLHMWNRDFLCPPVTTPLTPRTSPHILA